MTQVRSDFKMNKKQKYVYDLLMKGKSIFLTGEGGVGKTALLKRFITDISSSKIVGVTSTTGISALLFGGVTFHSFTGIGLGQGSAEALTNKIMKKPHMKKKWRDLEILVIDEISMLSPDLWDKVEEIAREVRHNSKPFGGLQIIASGDFLQLPCVDTDKFCFQARTWKSVIQHEIQLTENMRQRDVDFQKVLSKIRHGVVDQEVKEMLTSFYHEDEEKEINGIRPTLLYPTNRDVDRINNRELDKLAEQGAEFRQYVREVEIFRNVKNRAYVKERFEKNTIIPALLELAVGAQVMLIFNMDLAGGLVNGSRGVVTGFCDDMPVVKFLNGRESIIDYHIWEAEENEMKTVRAIQIPLKVAYALTIHKSQGASLDLVDVDLSDVFEYGQAYVALSRATTKEGLGILGLDFDRITASPKAVEYYATLE